MMMNQAFQKRGEPASAGRGRLRVVLCSLVCLLALAALLVCTAPARAAEAGEEAASAAQIAPCKGLKPYKNLDELLYQFYINLDSDCLFEMPTAELEEIWGIKILDDERAKPKNYYPLSETEFYNKPYASEKDAFYVELFWDKTLGNKFKLKITKSFFEKYGALFHEMKLPELLPEPSQSYGSDGPPCIFPDFLVLMQNNLKKERPPEGRCVSPVWRSLTKDNATIAINNPSEISIQKGNALRTNRMQKDTPAATTATDSKTDPCRGLKPFNNIDELLYQFYINLDDDCLFKLPPSELEKIWAIKIHIFDLQKEDNPYNSDFYLKPYNLEKDAFFVTMFKGENGRYNFRVRITKAYEEKHATLFPDGKYPKLLPPPIWLFRNRLGPALVFPLPPEPPRPKIQGKYRLDSEYLYWLNTDQTRMIALDGFYGVASIEVSHFVPDSFLKAPLP